MDDQQAVTVIEAALLCADAPMSVGAIQKLFESEDISVNEIRQWLESLQILWQDRGLELVETAVGWRFQSRVSMQRYLERLSPEQTPKYSRAVLETLAIIAWKQPVTRSDIEAIRGVTVSSQIIKTLEDRGWVETIGHRDGPGRPALLGTTKQFLDDLGLRALDELPPLQPVAQDPEAGAELALEAKADGEMSDLSDDVTVSLTLEAKEEREFEDPQEDLVPDDAGKPLQPEIVEPVEDSLMTPQSEEHRTGIKDSEQTACVDELTESADQHEQVKSESSVTNNLPPVE